MPIQNTIACQLRSDALRAVVAAGRNIPEGVSPAIREVQQVNAAIEYVALQLHDLVPSGLVGPVLLALAQQCSDPTAPLLGDLGKCRWYVRCENEATHLEQHPVLGSVPQCDRCHEIGQEPRL